MDRGVDRHRPALTAWRLAAIPLAFLSYLFVYPLVRILLVGGGGGFAEAWTTPGVRSAIWFSLWQATVSTLLTLAAGLPLTWALSRFEFPGKRLVGAFVIVPFVLPTVVVGSAFLALGWEGSVWAILTAHVFYNLAVVIRLVGAMWSRLDPHLLEAARTLGATPWRAFRTVTLPLLRPALAAAASLVFLFSFTSFGVVLILGGLRYRTIEVAIFEQARSFLDLPVAAALSIIQLVGVGLLLVAYSRYQRLHSTALRVSTANARPPANRRERWLLAAAVTATLGMLAVPLAVLVSRAAGGHRLFTADLPGIGDPLAALGNSVRFAVLAAVMAIVVGLAAARVVTSGPRRLSHGFDVLLMLPLGTSAVTIGLGFLVALDRPIDLRTSWVLVPLAHAVVAIPFVVRAAVPLLRAIRPELREAAAVLGASPARVWREIDLPIVARAALVGAGFSAAVSLGEFGATAFIVRPDTLTIPTLITRLLARPGDLPFRGALALAVMLMVLTAALMLAVDRWGETW